MPAVTLPTSSSNTSPASFGLGCGPSLPVLWLRRIRTRRALTALHPEQVREAGLDPWAVHAESGKPFWRA